MGAVTTICVNVNDQKLSFSRFIIKGNTNTRYRCPRAFVPTYAVLLRRHHEFVHGAVAHMDTFLHQLSRERPRADADGVDPCVLSALVRRRRTRGFEEFHQHFNDVRVP